MKCTWDFSEWLNFADKLSDAKRFESMINTCVKEIAKSLHRLLITNTPVDFGTLQSFWQTEENYSYLVERIGNKFSVTLINRAIYALWVNDGHRQRPGRFIPGYWEGNHFRYDPTADGGLTLKKSWVMGRFFVETSILQLENSSKLETILNKELRKWFRWCTNG